MNCREFNQKVVELPLAELAVPQDEQLLAHGSACAPCASLLQERHTLAGAMQGLRNSTATLDAPVAVEYAVMRAFRQSAVPATPLANRENVPPSFAFRMSRWFEVGAYGAVAAAVVICLGIGIWFWQHSAGKATSAAVTIAAVEQQTKPSASTPDVLPASQPGQAASIGQRSRSQRAAVQPIAQSAVTKSTEQDLTQIAQAQQYVPLMLCDPLSCSGDEQVVRMELPASAADASNGSAQPLMADVVVGDDGLVRAIRIVQ